MQLTDYQAKYFAYELTKRCPSDSVEKLAGVVQHPAMKRFTTIIHRRVEGIYAPLQPHEHSEHNISTVSTGSTASTAAFS